MNTTENTATTSAPATDAPIKGTSSKGFTVPAKSQVSASNAKAIATALDALASAKAHLGKVKLVSTVSATTRAKGVDLLDKRRLSEDASGKDKAAAALLNSMATFMRAVEKYSKETGVELKEGWQSLANPADAYKL